MAPSVSIIIPSLDGDRQGGVAGLEAALSRQTLRDHEVLVVAGVRPQGRAINQGARQARGRILVVLDDDSSVEDDELLQRLVATLESDPRIGMAGASLRPPRDATHFQRRAARELPRFRVPVVSRVTDSDLACHGCAAFPAAAFHAVGGEREGLLRGLDPDLRNRLRAAGYRVVLAPQAVIHHPLPATFSELAATYYRNGQGSAWAQVFHPELVFDTDETLERHTPAPRRPLALRALRLPSRIGWALLTARPLRAVAYTSYAVGYLLSLPRYLLRPGGRSGVAQ